MLDEITWNPFATMRAQVRRRLLTSYRVDPGVMGALLPPGFRPQLVDGSAVAGICVIGLGAVRPGWIVPKVGLRTENVAHRVAVEWHEGDALRRGVYIFGRHSSALLPVLLGDRLFPGVQTRARFDIDETASRFRIRMRAADAQVAVDAEVSDEWGSRLFPRVEDASEFYRNGSVGWSPRRVGPAVQPLDLSSERWIVQPARVDSIESSFFDALPAGSAEFDSALVMLDISTVWTRPRITRGEQAATDPAPSVAY